MLRNDLPWGADAVTVSHRTALSLRLSRFRDEEEGSLVIFGLFCFVCMLFVAGVALDMMRFEERRTILQNTIDRAILAAADLDQQNNCEDVIKDYFEKAGLAAPADSNIICQQGTFNEWRTASACTSEVMPTWFMKAFSVPTLTAPACGTAEERIGNVEISLVLDVSGSMNSNSRLVNLKPAAKAFVDQMFDTVEDGRLSMSIITFSTQVAMGPDLHQYFYTTGEHSSSSCIDFALGDYSSTSLSPKSTPVGTPAAPGDTLYKQTGHFDPFYSNLAYSTYSPSNWLTECPSDTIEPWRRTIAFSGDRDDLKDHIDSLQAAGNTSIDIGMKWGAALLDPSVAPIVDAMIATGDVDAEFGERPYEYSNDEALKVVVLMTDGANTTEYRLKTDFDGIGADNTVDNPRYRLYRNDTTQYSSTSLSRYSFYDADRVGNKYYSFYTNSWRSEPWGTQPGDISGTDTTTPMEWQEVWATMSMNYFANNIIYKAYGNSSTERNKWRTSATSPTAVTKIYSDKNDRTLDVCDAAKNQGVKIFTIGFEAPTAGLELIKSCATSPAHYYSVSGLQINTAFQSIAQSINKLRLTQ
jgi:hypothetical protein